VLAVVLAVVGVLLFNKSEILLSLGVLITGLTMVYRRTLVLTIGILLLGAVYFSVSGLAAYGRIPLEGTLGADRRALGYRSAVACDGQTPGFADRY